MFQDKIKNRLLSRFSKESLEQSVYMQSKGRTYDIDELTNDELQSLFYMFFPAEKPKHHTQRLYELEIEQELKRLRSVVLADAQYIGLYTPGNWTRFNQFMNYTSVLKKPLNRYEIDEFPELIKQFKSMRYKFNKSKTVVGTSAWFKFLGLKPSVN